MTGAATSLLGAKVADDSDDGLEANILARDPERSRVIG